MQLMFEKSVKGFFPTTLPFVLMFVMRQNMKTVFKLNLSSVYVKNSCYDRFDFMSVAH